MVKSIEFTIGSKGCVIEAGFIHLQHFYIKSQVISKLLLIGFVILDVDVGCFVNSPISQFAEVLGDTEPMYLAVGHINCGSERICGSIKGIELDFAGYATDSHFFIIFFDHSEIETHPDTLNLSEGIVCVFVHLHLFIVATSK